MLRRQDYALRWVLLQNATGQYPIDWLKEQYVVLGLSTYEIAEQFFLFTDVKITPRSILRHLRLFGITVRSKGDSFRNAIKRGRVTWHWKKAAESKRRVLPTKLRYQIMSRDNWACRLCGSKDYPEIDHIKPIVFGGDNSPENLRVLCHECNMGKRFAEREQVGSHCFAKKESEARRET